MLSRSTAGEKVSASGLNRRQVATVSSPTAPEASQNGAVMPRAAASPPPSRGAEQAAESVGGHQGAEADAVQPEPLAGPQHPAREAAGPGEVHHPDTDGQQPQGGVVPQPVQALADLGPQRAPPRGLGSGRVAPQQRSDQQRRDQEAGGVQRERQGGCQHNSQAPNGGAMSWLPTR